MALTSEQQAVFLLAVEKLETEGTKAMDHAAHAQVQTGAREGSRPVIDWAIDFLGCLPDNRDMARLICRAHMPQVDGCDEWTRREIRQCGGACRGFYSRIGKRGLFGPGLRYLRMINGG